MKAFVRHLTPTLVASTLMATACMHRGRELPAPIPKLDVWRAAVGKPLLHPIDPHILAIATDSVAALPPESPQRLPVIGLDDYDAIATFVSEHARVWRISH